MVIASRGQKEPDGESALRKQDLRPAGTRTEVSSHFTQEESALLHQLLTLPFDEAMALPLSAARRSSFSRRMLDYLAYHLGQALDIRSLDVLHAVFI